MRKAILLLLVWLAPALPTWAGAPDAEIHDAGHVIVFSKTTGWRHASIPAGIARIKALGSTHHFSVFATENDADLTPERLDSTDVLIFLNTTGDVLGAAAQQHFEDYILGGGGFVGIHSAADTEYDWPFYGKVIGAYFDSHPQIQSANVEVVDRTHPSTKHLPFTWERTDEWYNYGANPRDEVHVLAQLDEATYSGGTMSGDHPIAWCQEIGQGRSWYTGGGHTDASFSEDAFVQHLWGGIQWAAGWAEGDCKADIASNFQYEVLLSGITAPMDLRVDPQGRVLFIERTGRVRRYDPQAETTETLATIPVFSTFEEGLLGIELDPQFDQNGWVYLFYSRPSPNIQVLSRFTLSGSRLLNEEVLLEVPVQRAQCCHAGGHLAWDSQRNIYISLGDNVNPFESDGYAPIDERTGRNAWNAMVTSGNPFDFRGSILRIHVAEDGTTAIPSGNLFADSLDGLPEIYVMGARNPFRITVDAATDVLYWGDVGPDAHGDNPTRGPRGYDEVNRTTEAGFYGWPFCMGPNLPYRQFDFATGQSGASFDCAGGVKNESRYLPRAVTLPPAQPAWIYYPYGDAVDFPSIQSGQGRSVIMGPVYRNANPDSTGFPPYFNGHHFFADWSRNTLHTVQVDDEGNPFAITPFLSGIDVRSPISLTFGPSGMLYMLEWGTGYSNTNPDARLSRIQYRTGGRPPNMVIQASATSGTLPLEITFSATGSSDPDPGDSIVYYLWDVDGDGETDARGETITHTYTEAGTYQVTLRGVDINQLVGSARTEIVAGNTRPEVTFHGLRDGATMWWGDTLAVSVDVFDAEDGSTVEGGIACSEIIVDVLLGHDDHGHAIDRFEGCDGTVVIPTDSGHEPQDRVFLVVEVYYRDRSDAPLEVRETRILWPRQTEGEWWVAGTDMEMPLATGSAGGALGITTSKTTIELAPLSLRYVDGISFVHTGAGGWLRLTSDDEPIGQAWLEATQNQFMRREVTIPVRDTVQNVTIEYDGTASTGNPSYIDRIDFISGGYRGWDVPRGLSAEYHTRMDLGGRSIDRVEPHISFSWGSANPFFLVPADGFSVRWSGYLLPPEDGAYQFALRGDDGYRLRLDGETHIDQWVNQAVTQVESGTVALTAGQPVFVEIEYFENAGDAQIQWLWKTPSGNGFEVVPTRVLYPRDSPVASERGQLPIDEGGLTLYPNPTISGRVTATSSRFTNTDQSLEVRVFDALGRRVWGDVMDAIDGTSLELDLSALSAGWYLVEIMTASGPLRTPMIRMP